MIPDISIIITHRGNPEVLKEFYRQVFATAVFPEKLEVITCVDDDDPDCHHIYHEGLEIKQLVFPPGTKGATYINTAYKASTGRLIMLLATDVIIHTPGWDVAILDEFAKWPDEIGLVYPNDLIFKGILAQGGMTVSRKACEIVGYVTHPAYKWFRSEDHMHDLYDILQQLGHARIVYLPDVIIEHLSYVMVDGVRRYDKAVPDAVVRGDNLDAQRYMDLRKDREFDALNLAMFIDPDQFTEYVDMLKKLPGPFPNYFNVEKLIADNGGQDLVMMMNGKKYPIRTWRGEGISPYLENSQVVTE